VAAAQRIVPVLVDCSERGQNEDLLKKYGVQGFPTVIYADPDGKQIKEMDSRDAGTIVKDIDNLSKKHPGRPSIWQSSTKAAVDLGKQVKKPVAVYLAEPKEDLAKLTAKLMKDLGDRKTKFLWVLELGKDDVLKKYAVDAAPAVVVLDPKADEPLAKIPVKADDKADVLNKALDDAAKQFKK